MKVLFNADDFGLTKGVTDGIIKAYKDGVVSSATLMMNGKAIDYAVSQAKKHPLLNIGIHLVLTWGKPISGNVPSLLDNQGFFKFKNTFLEVEDVDVDAVEREWCAQIDAFLATGLPLHHIDSHHHIHGWGLLKEVVVKLAQRYNVPVRYVESLKGNPEILLTETLWLDFYGEGVDYEIFHKLQQLDTTSVEVMTHPAVIDEDLKEFSSYIEKREQELEILCGLQVPNWVEDCS